MLDSNPYSSGEAYEIVVLPCCVKASVSEVKTDVNTRVKLMYFN